jgi:hypothetical protein
MAAGRQAAAAARATAVEVLFGMHYAKAVTVDDQGRPVADLTRLSLVEPDPSIEFVYLVKVKWWLVLL